MADLQPAQIPNFSLGAAPITTANIGEGLATGLTQGTQLNQGQQALFLKARELAQQKQLQNSQIQQQTIGQVDSLLKTGLSYPGLLPSFWPTIATKMNQLSPDYKLDPKSPPENINTFAKALSDISDGVQDKVVTPPQAHSAVKQLIQTSYPTGATAALGDPGQPQSQPPQQPQPGGQGMSGGQPSPQQSAPPQGAPAMPGQAPGAPAQPPPDVPNLLQLKSQYDKASSLIAQAPMDQQKDLRAQLDNSSLGQNYKQSLDNHFKQIDSQYTQGQTNQRTEFDQNQSSIRSLTSSFENQSQDAKTVFDNLNVFHSQMELSKQFANAKDTTGAVSAEKAALAAFVQMTNPGAARLASPEAIETIAKSGPFKTLMEQAFNKIDRGEIMTESQIKGLRQAALGIAQAREQSQSDQENTTASAIQLHGGNPIAFLRNYRPSTLASTSKLFPNQSGGGRRSLIGETRKLTIDGKQGTYKALGTNGADPDNWVPAGDDEQ